MDIALYNDVDREILELSKQVKVLRYCSPINTREAYESYDFSRGKSPDFEYRDNSGYDGKAVLKRLDNISVPDGVLQGLYERRIRTLKLENAMICRHKENPDISKVVTELIYGKPSKDLVDYARQIIDDFEYREENLIITPEQVRDSMVQAFDEYGLPESWRVELSEGSNMISIDGDNEVIYVPSKKMFPSGCLERYKVHEVGIHAVRAANGREQVLGIFGTEMPDYLSTEEGLATFYERYTGNLDEQKFREYALRVLAVDSVARGESFVMTFDMLVDPPYDLKEKEAFNLATRAHRAGGFIKDHVYMQGMREVSDYAGKSGDMKRLFVGKIGLCHLDLVDMLLEKGVLKPPKYLPNFVQ